MCHALPVAVHLEKKMFVSKDCFCHELTTFQILASNSHPFFSYSHLTILKILLLLVSHKKHVSRSPCSCAPTEKNFILKDCFWHELTTFQILASNSQSFFSYSHHTILKILLLLVSHKKNMCHALLVAVHLEKIICSKRLLLLF